jgi:hypothetical protein
MRNRTLLLLLTGAALLVASAAGAAAATSVATLPDWSGDWVVQPFKDSVPPYAADWIAKRRAKLGTYPAADPAQICGMLSGTPRSLGMSGIHEWIITSGAVRHALENDFNSVQRIFTDGRPHKDPDLRFPTYTGDNIGRWEGDVLVIDTVALRDDTWLDDLGHDHSDQTHIITRVRKLSDGRLEARAQIEDSEAFTKPWTITRYYKRLPAGSFVHDYACGIVTTGAQAAKIR